MLSSALTTVLWMAGAYVGFRVLRFYFVERGDPWFWGEYGLGAPSGLRLVHFVLKIGAAIVSNLPTGVRLGLLRIIRASRIFPQMADSTLDFDFDNYNGLARAPTVAKGVRALGMRNLCEWLYRPRHFSVIKSEYTHPLCRPILFMPGIKIKPFYPPRCKDFPWIERFEEATATIREEFLSLSKNNPKAVGTYLVPEDMKSTVSGWRTFFFTNPQGKQMVENQKLCPKTWEILNTIPGFVPENMTMFSVLSPGAEILPHCGLTNAVVRIHLPIIVPQPTKSVIRVGEKVRTWEEGKVLAFNDAYDHQVWNFGSLTRVVLFFDVWHPDLSEEDLAVIKKGWENIKQSMGKVADEYERMSKRQMEADPEDVDDWLITEKDKDT
mmetsp:Transcript_10755/g.22298  ORF Transcript_10755/g.22298 Transcript_10755/m.22298 type:complete len:381 (-) Transcript_10755:548-1690(-)